MKFVGFVMFRCEITKKNISLYPQKGTCGCGVIGSRARLRIWWRKPWGFESLQPHENKLLQEKS